MTNDVIRAVERLKIYRDNPSDDVAAIWKWGDAEFGRVTVMADILTVATAALPLFDPEPITEQWLRSMGGEIENYEPEDGTTVTFRSDFGDSEDEPETYGLSVFSDGTASIGYSDIFSPCKTRGDVRLLAKALGIPLTEQL